MNGWLLAAAAALAIAVIDRALVVQDQRKHLDELEETIEQRDTLLHSIRTANASVHAAMAPLMERTDWMTGRWHGQFEQLTLMEQERNRQAQVARAVYFSHPDISDAVRKDPAAFIPKGVTL